MDYFQLPKHKRWLQNNTPANLGGRSTDIAELGHTLSQMVSEWYGILNTPAWAEAELSLLCHGLQHEEQRLQKLIQDISTDINDTYHNGEPS